MAELDINSNQYLELEKLGLGAFAPLRGFMDEDDFVSTVDRMSLASGEAFSIPIVLDISRQQAADFKGARTITLRHGGEVVGELQPDSYYIPDKRAAVVKIFGVSDMAHPGVNYFLNLKDVFVGGEVKLIRRIELPISKYELTPAQTKATFAERGFKTVVGFQTRNVPHRAHEYLQRTALELVDGLFIQPLVGHKKAGDYTPEAIMRGYSCLIENFYPKNRVVLGVLSTAMRYAGPREAVFHAIIRRNYGCTHFIVGRDHAGVGGYYGKYAAHRAVEGMQDRLGITVMRLHGPYFCETCDSIVTEKTCPHEHVGPPSVRHINGSDMRTLLVDGEKPDPRLLRPEIIESLKGLSLCI
jgi:sulfate adenylyltransferase